MKKALYTSARAILTGLTLLASGSLFAQVDVSATSGTASGTYATLKDAIDKINDGTHQGSIKVEFTSGTTESVKSTLNASGNGAASYSDVLIGVKSGAGTINVTSNVAGDRMLDISGSNVTIDGRAGQTGTSGNLNVFVNPANGSGLRVIAIAPNAVNNVKIQYFDIRTTNNVSTGSGIFLGTSVQTAAASNLVVRHSITLGFSSGITIGSAASPSNTSNVKVDSNQTVDGLTGINLNANGSATGTIHCRGNNVRHMSPIAISQNANVFGIITNTSSSNTSYVITNNTVYDLNNSSNTGNPQIFGIILQTGTGISGQNFLVANNNVQLTGAMHNRGVLMEAFRLSTGTGTRGAGAAGTYNILNNTFSVAGTTNPGGYTSATNASRAGFFLYGNNTNSTLTVKNNIFRTTRTGGNTVRHFSVITPAYDYVSATFQLPATGCVANFDNNVYFQNDNTNIHQVVVAASGGALTFGVVADFKANILDYTQFVLDDTYGTTNDRNSHGYDVQLAGVTNPTLGAASQGNVNMIGTPTSVTTDYFGTTRAAVPHIGAHEPNVAFPVDLSVVQIYTLGRIPKPYAFPHGISAAIRNNGVVPTPAGVATLEIKGGVNVTRTASYGVVAPGATAYVNFADITDAEYSNSVDSNLISVILPSDDDVSNDTMTILQDPSVNTYSLGYRNPGVRNPVFDGGVGFTGATGDFVAKFLCSQPSSLNQVKVYFSGTLGNAGQPYRIVVFADDSGGTRPGSLIYTSPLYTSVPGGFDTKAILPDVPVSGNFYVGLRQTGTVNLGFAFQSENPVRENAFFSTSPQGSVNWEDFSATGSPYKFLIEPRLRVAKDLSANVFTAPQSSGCFGTGQTISLNLFNSGFDAIDFAATPATVRITVNGGPYQNFVINKVLNSGVLLSDDTLLVTHTGLDMSQNGTYTFNAVINWAQDLVTDNNTFPQITRLVSRAAAFPINIGFTPTASVPNSLPLQRNIVQGNQNWVFAATQGSPSLFPLSGTGVLTTSLFNAQPNTIARAQLPCLTMPVSQFPVLQLYMSQDNVSTNADSLRVMFSYDGGLTYNWHSSYARFNAGGTGWRTVKVNLPTVPDLRIALDAKASSGLQNTGRDISVHDVQIYDCGTGGLWLGSNGDWFDGQNWCSGTVPDANTDVVIASYNGVANPVVSGAAAECKNLTIRVSKSLTLDSTLTVNGNVVVNQSATLSASGNGASLVVNGGPGASINFSGQTVTIPTVKVSGTVTLATNSTLRVNDLFKVEPASAFTNSGKLVLLSEAGRTANLGTIDNSSVFAGNVTWQRYVRPASALGTGGYHQLAGPIQGTRLTEVANALGNRINIRLAPVVQGNLTFTENVWFYDPTSSNLPNNGWVVPGSLTHNIAGGTAVRLWLPNAFWSVTNNIPDAELGKLVLTGTPNQGTGVVNLNYCPGGCAYSGADPNGYNLVGNLYPSAVDWNAISKSNVDDAIWVWNAQGGNYGSFVAGVGANEQTEIIPSGAGFFVRANSAGASVTFDESDKAETNTGSTFLRSGRNTLFRMKMTTAANANLSDEAVVVFRPTATRGYDRHFDAAKMSGSLMNISTVPVAGQKMIINSMPEMTAQREDLVLDVNASADGQYNINFNGFENIDAAAVMYLRDNYTGTLTQITDGLNYSFTINNANAATHGSGRFVITYGLGTPTSLNNAVGRPVMNVYPNPAATGQEFSVAVENLSNQNVKLSIVDVVGRQVYNTTFNVSGTEAQAKAINANLTSGIYTVVLEGNFGHMTQKVTVK